MTTVREDITAGITRVLKQAEGVHPAARALTTAIVNVAEVALGWQEETVLDAHKASLEILHAISEGLSSE